MGYFISFLFLGGIGVWDWFGEDVTGEDFREQILRWGGTLLGKRFFFMNFQRKGK